MNASYATRKKKSPFRSNIVKGVQGNWKKGKIWQPSHPIPTGRFSLLGPGGDCLVNSENGNKTYRTESRQKFFPFRSATQADDVIWRNDNIMFWNGGHLGSYNLYFSIFPKPPKSTKFDQKVIKTNKGTRKWSKNVKITSRVLSLFIKKEENSTQKFPCQKVHGCHGI